MRINTLYEIIYMPVYKRKFRLLEVLNMH